VIQVLVLLYTDNLLHCYLPVSAVGSDRSETESEDGLMIPSSQPSSCINTQVWLGRCTRHQKIQDTGYLSQCNLLRLKWYKTVVQHYMISDNKNYIILIVT